MQCVPGDWQAPSLSYWALWDSPSRIDVPRMHLPRGYGMIGGGMARGGLGDSRVSNLTIPYLPSSCSSRFSFMSTITRLKGEEEKRKKLRTEQILQSMPVRDQMISPGVSLCMYAVMTSIILCPQRPTTYGTLKLEGSLFEIIEHLIIRLYCLGMCLVVTSSSSSTYLRYTSTGISLPPFPTNTFPLGILITHSLTLFPFKRWTRSMNT